MELIATAKGHGDWDQIKHSIDLTAVATNLLGPAPGRRGERGRRLWWRCPFHEDRNPSFCVDPGRAWWKCFGCGATGDAAALVMRLEGKTFPEAKASLTGRPAPSGKPAALGQNPKLPGESGFCPGRPRPPTKPPVDAPTEPKGMLGAGQNPEPLGKGMDCPGVPAPSGMPEADALALVADAERRLWTPEGAHALAYLREERHLAPETIRAARLGWTPGVTVPKADGSAFRTSGVTVPWSASGRLALVKVRQPDGRRPKYAEVFRDLARLVCYPGPEAIRSGRPLVVVEGEFDALALGEALGELAAVVTLGSASARPDPAILGRMSSPT